jgi:KDO2-lipid IV(A) lauroyltransferase
MKNLRYLTEAILFHILMFILGLLPLDVASNFGGWVGRSIGPRLAASRKAFRNLQLALPDLDENRYDEIIKGMWDNLGRVMAEYPHLDEIGKSRVEVTNPEVARQLEKDEQPAILFGAHIANWECGAYGLAQHGLDVGGVYRAPNNPWMQKTINKLRSRPGYPKSKTGMRLLMKALKDGEHIGILIDQKYNEGVAVPFLGHLAMTSPAFVQLAQKFKCPMVSVHIVRTKGANFQVTLSEPVDLFDGSGAPLPIEDIIKVAHRHLEEWIKERPEQWLWLHKRWSSKRLESYKEAA